MGKTRRRRIRRRRKNRKQKNNVHVPWSDFNHDVLYSVMMRLGVVEFYAFSGVCKSWRSLAVSNKNKFIVSKPPMSIHVSQDKCIHFKDYRGRKFKPMIPHYAGRMCIGVTSGYLILLGEKNYDLWLVNLITRHKLHFRNVPDEFFCCPGTVRAVLVFSASISGWVLVVLNFCTHRLWFSVEGKHKWIEVSTPSSMCDLHAFKGKIYIIHSSLSDQAWLSELRLYPEPELVLLETESIYFSSPGLVSCGEKLYVINRISQYPYKTIHELDFGKMKWVSCEKKGKEYAFYFRNMTEHGSYATTRIRILPESLVDLRSEYDISSNHFHAKIWYFFHDCLNVDQIH